MEFWHYEFLQQQNDTQTPNNSECSVPWMSDVECSLFDVFLFPHPSSITAANRSPRVLTRNSGNLNSSITAS